MRRSSRLPLEALLPYTLDLPRDPAQSVSWQSVFGNDHSVEIEVGSGKGLFLLTAALARPDVNFLGIEIVRKYQLFAATRLAKRQLGNARMACADALALFRQHVASATVQAVHVYFPDPWWKKRHHKRRVFNAAFVAEIARILRPGGQLFVATDVEAYFHLMAELIEQCPALTRQPTQVAIECQTNFEMKALRAGRSIHRLLATRSDREIESSGQREGMAHAQRFERFEHEQTTQQSFE